jgi:hypothetical protein
MLFSSDIAMKETPARTNLVTARTLAIAIATMILIVAAGFGTATTHATSYYDQAWLSARHNWAFRNGFPRVDALFNSFDYGHAKLYETLWRDPQARREILDDREFRFITRKLLRHPPTVPLDEGAIAPEWEKLAPEAAAMFDWAHMLHRQIYDVWADDRISESQKDAKVTQLVRYYRSRSALAFSTSPKNMNLMEGQPYSLSFRKPAREAGERGRGCRPLLDSHRQHRRQPPVSHAHVCRNRAALLGEISRSRDHIRQSPLAARRGVGYSCRSVYPGVCEAPHDSASGRSIP